MVNSVQNWPNTLTAKLNHHDSRMLIGRILPSVLETSVARKDTATFLLAYRRYLAVVRASQALFKHANRIMPELTQ